MSFDPTKFRPYTTPGWGAAAFRGRQGTPGGIGGQSGNVVYRSPGGNANWQIVGVTRNSSGVVLGSCNLDLFITGSDQLAMRTVSDASGNFTFANPGTGPFYIVAYKAGSPDVAGTTVNTVFPTVLIPTILPSTNFYTGPQINAVQVGLVNTTTDVTKIYGYAGGETLFVFRVNGTSAVMHLWSGFGDDGTLCSVSVDGGAYVNVSASSGDSHTIFTGLSNSTHIVLVKYGSAYGNTPYILSSGTVLELTGAPPTLNTPVAWLDTFNTANVIGSALKVTGQANYVPAQMPGTVTSLITRPAFMFSSSTSYLDIISGSKYVYVSIDGASPTRYDLGPSINPNSYMGYLRVPTSGTHRYNVWRDTGASANVYTHLYVGVDSAPSATSAGRIEQWGDSITFGLGSSSVGEVEVYRVASALGYNGQAYGISGLTTANLDANIASQLAAKVSVPANDVCVIAIGRNDIGNAFSAVSANYSSIISKVLPYYKKVLCRGVLPDSSGPYTAWNAGLSALVTSLSNPNVVYIDPATWTGVTTVDGTHPSDAGYTTLAGYAQTAYTPYV